MANVRTIAVQPIAGSGHDSARALETARSLSPYLSQILMRRPELEAMLKDGAPHAIITESVAAIAASAGAATLEDAMRDMRLAKELAHGAIAAADLAGAFTLDEVVGALTDLADAAVDAALALAVREVARSGRFAGFDFHTGRPPGLFALAMGKMGARELNYSSDVDLIVLFDLDRIPNADAQTKAAMTRVAQVLVKVLEERTADGYVFRTDLRLRPDPGSTSPALSTQFALGYYESVGQNWERMAHIKARVCAGDREAGNAYLGDLVPYIWRRHLDYWAINDIHSIKRQIHAHEGHAALAAPEFDIKLGRGGIREIEFFAQVQQLILGGRYPDLRAPRTKDALAALADAEVITRDVQQDLTAAYDYLRGLEHRVQMIRDEQTHMLAKGGEQREAVARLAGYVGKDAFDSDIVAVRSRVHDVYSELFALEERLSGVTGNLVFTGVDPDPGTVATLKEMGYSNPERVIEAVQNWHRGGVPATRSARGRQLLTTLGPRLLEVMSETGEPDAAFERFRDFFGGLKAGVQTLSLMMSEPGLAKDLIETMVFAPKIGADLSRRPALLDAMLDPHFSAPVSNDNPGDRLAALQGALSRSAGFEEALNIARRFHREEAFRIGYQLLRGRIHAPEAGEAFADLADACVVELAKFAEAEAARVSGGPFGAWTLCALGKFGGRELTATSDLDVMLVYAPDGEEAAPRAARFVQRLVAALSAPTEEGALYEVDMQLRPSGRSGPVAVSVAAFEGYYRNEAWTWEYMALTRLRPVAGDSALGAQIAAAAHAILELKSDNPAIDADVLDMRRRLARDRAAKSHWDLKLAPGGLMDIEFVIQHALLKAAGRRPVVLSPHLPTALDALVEAGEIDAADGEALSRALSFQLDLQQLLRLASGEDFHADTAAPSLKAWLAQRFGEPSFDDLDRRLRGLQTFAAQVRLKRLGDIAQA